MYRLIKIRGRKTGTFFEKNDVRAISIYNYRFKKYSVNSKRRFHDEESLYMIFRTVFSAYSIKNEINERLKLLS